MTTIRPTMMTARATGVRQRSPDSLTDALRQRIADRCPDPSILNERQPFAFSAVISSGALDSWWTKMHRSTLTNFARDADAGVSVLPAHRHRGLPVGATVAGAFADGANPSVSATSFMLPGLTLDGVSTDSLIDAIRGGIARDVSVGFTPGRFECNLCGGDPYDWLGGGCVHVPGVAYGKSDRPENDGERCWCWVVDGRLNEVSLVYAGATPDAEVTAVLRSKVASLVGDGRVAARDALVLTRSVALLEESGSGTLSAGTRASPSPLEQFMTGGTTWR